jgi:transcription-repair coupling factor (superfamily II helicase)
MSFILPADYQHLEGITPEAELFVLADLYDACSGDLVCIARDESSLHTLVETLPYLLPTTPILSFPAWDCLPYDRVSPRRDISGQRVSTLVTLTTPHRKRALIVTTLSALLQRVPPQDDLALQYVALEKQHAYNRDKLLETLTNLGYTRTSNVHEPGEYAVRGSLLDIFPANADNPYRLDFFDESLESLKVFDPLTQRSLTDVESLTLAPSGEVLLTDKTVTSFRTAYRDHFPTKLQDDILYQSISAHKPFMGQEHWLPLFYEKLESLPDYLKDPYLVFTEGYEEATRHRFEQIHEYYQARTEALKTKQTVDLRYNPLHPEELYVTAPEFKHLLQEKPKTLLTPFRTREEESLIHPLPPFTSVGTSRIEALTTFLKDKGRHGHRIHIACGSEGRRHQLMDQLREAGFLKLQSVTSWAEAQGVNSKLVCLHVWPLEKGFSTNTFTLLTDFEVVGEAKKRPTKRSRRSDLFIAEASVLSEGDLVVHEDHGIGRYEGLETLSVQNISHDCLRLLYADGVKLFLPVENIDLISRYGGESSQAVLDHLGAAHWQARKAQVKKRLEELAGHLIELAAQRSLKEAETFTPDTTPYEEFLNRFLFVETPDQQRTIEDVLMDLSSGKPMDRLVCGDVGFGKTEVALRAAFVVASQGKQVALLAPTTLLVRQHYANFKRRFEGFGLTVVQLSRFVSAKESTRIKEELKEGRISVVIGTHTLLAQNFAIKNLGLVIVDEEQHFGVKQKERLKTLQTNAHVLTLTATPIPRTLQLSLTGVRDMSVIATPPVDRLAIRTFVTPFDPVIIQEAIHRELHRGGQIYFVCPRIKDLDDVLEHLQKIDSTLRIAVAHGQMPARALEDVMDGFMDRHYDILLATNIIESGIDLPTVNTLFIHRSDLFGLAQLYQLRGRIGRGKERAYAYLTYPGNQVMSKTALKRLEVLQTLDTLGAGFQIASHDMDIRGAGNLLGAEQSGHVREVGVELYQQMLEEAVQKARSAATQEPLLHEHWSPQINIGVPVLIPEPYVSDLPVRLELYRRLARLESQEELDDFALELLDRFGPYPSEVQNLLHIMNLKHLARQASVSKIEVGDKGAVLTFHKNQFAAPDKLIAYIQDEKGLAKIRPDQTVFLTRVWTTPEERFTGCTQILKSIAGLL